MQHNSKLTAVVLLVFASMGAAHSHDLFDDHPGPTFDCQGELSSVEEWICHPEGDFVQVLDRMLSAIYEDKKLQILENPIPSVEELVKTPNGVTISHPYKALSELIADQRQWLAYRDSLSYLDHIEEAYKSRISKLSRSAVFLYASDTARNTIYTAPSHDGICIGKFLAPMNVEGRCEEEEHDGRAFTILIADGYVAVRIDTIIPYYHTCRLTYFGELIEFNEHYKIELGVNGLNLAHQYTDFDPCEVNWGEGTYITGTWGTHSQN